MTALLTSAARLGGSPAVLEAIREADCNLAIWQRAPLADFAPLIAGEPVDLRFETTPEDLLAALRSGLAGNGFDGSPALHELLVQDAAMLARHYCAALGLTRIELRLEVVRTDYCRKFHADYVHARLITTYDSEGTDWLDCDDAERVAAGQEPRQINRMAACDVGLFKGKLATDRPAIHRSPPIAGTGAARLLLVLHPAQKLMSDRPHSPFSRGSELA